MVVPHYSCCIDLVPFLCSLSVCWNFVPTHTDCLDCYRIFYIASFEDKVVGQDLPMLRCIYNLYIDWISNKKVYLSFNIYLSPVRSSDHLQTRTWPFLTKPMVWSKVHHNQWTRPNWTLPSLEQWWMRNGGPIRSLLVISLLFGLWLIDSSWRTTVSILTMKVVTPAAGSWERA